jgi:hypothetical protein
MGKAARRRKLLLGEHYGTPRTFKPYRRAHPMSPLMHEIWRSACEEAFALYGRGVLFREVALGLGQVFYVTIADITDPIGLQVLNTYDPAKEFVVAEPNEKGGTRWQVFQR